MALSTYLKMRDASLPSGGHPPVAGMTIPVLSGLVGAYLTSGGAAMATLNCVSFESDAQVAGSPQDVDRYVRFGAGASVKTPHPETAAATILFIGRKTSSETPAGAVGAYNLGGEAGDGILLFAPGASWTLQVKAASGRVLVAFTADVTAWGMYAATVPALGGGYAIRNLTTGVINVSSSTSDRLVTDSKFFELGDSKQLWSVDTLGALIYNRVLTGDEIDQLETWGRRYAADFGVTV